MIKNIILLFCIVVFAVKGFAQQNTASPYSYFGLGQTLFKGTEDIKAMGGLSIKGDSLALNLSNPASYSYLELTNFSIGATSSFTTLKNNSTSDNAKRTNLDYLALGIPMGKWGASFGITPYSTTGYKIASIFEDDNGYTRSQNFDGEGNINRVFLGTAYAFNNKLSAGINLEYNFGKFENTIVDGIDGVQWQTRELNESQINGFSTNIGLMYKDKLNEKLELYSSITYAPQAKLNSQNYRNIATVTYTTTGGEYISEEHDGDLPDSDLVIPSKFTLGFGVGKKNKWMIGTEIALAQNKEMTNRFEDDIRNYEYENGQNYVIGGYFVPNYNPFSSLFSRSVYRAGFRYSKTGLVVNNQSINDYGMNFGIGIPVGLSKIDLGFEFGKRGTTKSGLIQENYFNISIGLSLTEKWFRKTYVD